MAQIGSLSVKLGLVTVEWDKATDNAKRSAKELQTQFNALGDKVKSLSDKFKDFTGIGAALGFGALYHEAVALTDEISDLSKSFGLSTGEVLAFGDALQQSGGKAENADKALNTLFGKIADAKTGNDEAIAQFQKLGISFDDMKKASPYEMLQKVASGFSNISDQFEKTKAIKDFYGKAGIGLDVQNLADILKDGSKEFDKYDASIQSVGQVSDALKKNLTNLTLAFADLIAPFSQSHVFKIEQFSAALKGIAAASVVLGIGALAASFANLASAIMAANVAGGLFNITAGGATPLGLIFKALSAAAAIGTFLYITQGEAKPVAGESPRWKEMGEQPFPKPSEVQAAINAGGRSETPAFKFSADEAKLASNQAHKETPPKGAVEESVSNEVKAKRASIELTKQLIELDKQRNAVALNLSLTELQKKERSIDLEAQKKTAQINAQEKQQLATGGDKMSKEMKAEISNEAAAKRAQVNQEKTDALATARQADVLRRQKESLDAQEASRQELGQMQNELDTFVNTQGKSVVAFYDQAEEADRIAKLANERTAYENSLLMLSDKQRQNLMDEYDLEKTILDIRRQAKDLNIDVEGDAFAKFTANMRATGKATIALKRQQQDAQSTFEYGWQNAFNSYIDNATNAAKVGADSFNAVFGSMGNALDQFVETGKISFAGLAKSIILDLIKIQLRSAAMSFFSNLFGMPNFSGSASIPLQAGGGYAEGGEPPVGIPSLVGEAGPELFIPKTAGTIIPNNQLGNMGATTNNTVYNINAIDTKSFEERILGSSRAVWAANAYGAKSVAVGRGRT